MALASLLTGALFVAVTLIPGFFNFPVGEQSLGWNELWQTRLAIAALADGLLMLALGFGIVRRQAWTRVALIIMPVLQYLPFQMAHFIWGAPNPLPFDKKNLLGMLVWAVIIAVYLIGSKAARDHFSDQDMLSTKADTL